MTCNVFIRNLKEFTLKLKVYVNKDVYFLVPFYSSKCLAGARVDMFVVLTFDGIKNENQA